MNWVLGPGYSFVEWWGRGLDLSTHAAFFLEAPVPKGIAVLDSEDPLVIPQRSHVRNTRRYNLACSCRILPLSFAFLLFYRKEKEKDWAPNFQVLNCRYRG